MSPLPIVPPTRSGESDDFVYFAYGSSLDFDAFRQWCGQHGYEVPELSKAAPAVLEGYELRFNVRSRFWGGGTASLAKKEGGRVEGIAIPMPGKARGLVKHKEGVNSGLYREVPVEIAVGGQKQKALAYEASPDRVDESVAPSAGFVEALVRGAEARGLSAGWIAHLKSFVK